MYLKFTRPTASIIFSCQNLKELTSLQLRLIHLDEHNFKDNYQDTLIPFVLVVGR